jgi:hypothetical protein
VQASRLSFSAEPRNCSQARELDADAFRDTFSQF